MTRLFKVADLFCGAGGSSTGAEKAIRAIGGEMENGAVPTGPAAQGLPSASSGHGSIRRRAMKAWYVCERDGDGGGIVWADTQGKAKYKAWKSLEILDTCDDWREIECRRAPAFDGEERELTGRDWVEADYTFPCEHCERTVHKDGIWISPDDDEWTMPVFGAHGEVYCSDECRDKEVAFFTVG